MAFNHTRAHIPTATGWFALATALALLAGCDQSPDLAFNQAPVAVTVTEQPPEAVAVDPQLEPSFATTDTELICERPEVVVNPVYFQVRRAHYSAEQQACWANWEQAQALMHETQGLWVDVRDAVQVQRLGLSNAAQVDLAAMAERSFLWGQVLVLIGTGVDLPALSERCLALRSSGRYKSVHVLLGGARTWVLAGQPVLRNVHDLLPPQEIHARDFWLGLNNDQWRVALLGVPQDRAVMLAADDTNLPLDLGTDIGHAIDALKEKMVATPLPPQQHWLVVAGSDEMLAQAQRAWSSNNKDTGSSAPLWLSGGWPAYVNYMQQQNAVAKHSGNALPALCGV